MALGLDHRLNLGVLHLAGFAGLVAVHQKADFVVADEVEHPGFHIGLLAVPAEPDAVYQQHGKGIEQADGRHQIGTPEQGAHPHQKHQNC